MMHSVLMVAALLAAASKGLQTTYTAGFVSPQAFAQDSEYFKETTVNVLESISEKLGITVTSATCEGTTCTFVVNEQMSTMTGQVLCSFYEENIADAKEVCFVDSIKMGETVMCTISSFDNYAAQCTSDVSSRYYLGSPLAATIDKNEIDALILNLYSGTLVRYVSSEKNDTHYTVDVTETYKGEFAEMFCLGASAMPDPGKMCALDSLSDGNQEYCKPSEGAACQPHDSMYGVSYPFVAASQFDKDTLDAYANAVIAKMVQLGSSATFISSSNLPSKGIYTVFVNETTPKSFGNALAQTISEDANLKCMINEVVDHNSVQYYRTPDECFSEVEYYINFHPAVLSEIDFFEVTTQIQGLCEVASAKGINVSFAGYRYSTSNATYAFTVNEQMPGLFGNVVAEAVKGGSPLKCVINEIFSDDVYYTTPAECFRDVEYNIKFLSMAASKIDTDQITAQIKALCQAASAQGLKTEFVSDSYDTSSTTYAFIVKEKVAGLFGNVTAKAIKGDATLKCVSESLYRGEVVYFTYNKEECLADVTYSIQFLRVAASQIDPDNVTAQIQGMCQMVSAQGLKTVFVNSSYDISSAIYTFTVKEQVAGVAGNATADAIKGDATLKCVVESLYSGEVVYFAYTEDECLVDVTYSIQFLSAIAPKIDPDNITAQIQTLCQAASAQGFKTEFVSKSYDVSTANYTFTVKETFPGAFGNATAKAIKNTELKCLVKKISGNNDVEYLTFNEDECYFTTVYKFGLSMNTPDTINKEFIDGLMLSFVNGETLVYVESNFTSSLYTVTIKELQEGSVSDNVCSMLPGFVSMKGELCYVTFVKYGDNEAECTPRVDDYCAKINPGVTTLYEVKYYGNMSTKEELDAFFEAACKYARDASGENVKLVSSTYSKKNYKPTIVEPVTGIFGSHFCRYINDDYKCDFGSLKSGGNDYCNNPECKSAAFGFAPLAFLMALIFAFFF